MQITELLNIILVLAGFCILSLILAKMLRLDQTLSALMCGVFASIFIPWLGIETGIRAHNIHDLVFYLILPVLIFESAWHLKPHLLKRWLTPILSLATIGSVLSCFIVAVISYYAIGYPNYFTWPAALLLGAMLAATDPVSVVALLKKEQASDDLTTLVEGESLFNDATAIVLFSILLAYATDGEAAELNWLSQLSVFVQTFIGGIFIGAILGLLSAIFILFIGQNSAANIILLFTAFVSMYIAEHIVHVSGILAVMTTALLSRRLLKDQHDRLLADTAATWQWLGLFFNTLIFFLMGLVILFEMFTQQWLAILIAIFASLVARTISVSSVSALLRLTPCTISIQTQKILIWGGLRGAIAVVLVLSLPTSLPYWWELQSMVLGCVLFSIIVQGTTVSPLLKTGNSSLRE
ncbi:cation:proton antiporter [Gayadomonas joobiniege]|uniref:cation:proton antiporter n=1 Tax=Gayadomonas joobiniege TaxID=1234606 RepID=UPI00035F27A4|nr:sodium:proton antiporter [Gayadomonas joobiniege]